MRVSCGASVVVAGVLLLVPGRARAADGDGAYGRLDGDMTLVGGLGGGLFSSTGRTALTADVRLRYLEAAGAFVQYEEADALKRGDTAGDVRRSVAAGVELRPLFPARFLKNKQGSGRFFDLLIDSFAIDLGTWFSVRRASAVQRPGLLAGLAIEAPITGNASGLWLRLSVNARWSAQRLEGEGSGDPGGRTLFLGLGFAWHEVLGAHVVDRGDPHVK